jgi:hypothetical protein
VLDSREDFDLLILARELDAGVVTEDTGIINWAEDFGLRYLRGRDFPTLLDEYLETNRTALPGVSESNPYLFPSRQGEDGHITRNRANRIVYNAADKAGLQREYVKNKQGHTQTVPTMHTLRHSYAVQSILNGMILKDLQYALGHHDISSTLKYLKALERGRVERLREHSAGPTNDDSDVRRSSIEMNRDIFLD